VVHVKPYAVIVDYRWLNFAEDQAQAPVQVWCVRETKPFPIMPGQESGFHQLRIWQQERARRHVARLLRDQDRAATFRRQRFAKAGDRAGHATGSVLQAGDGVNDASAGRRFGHCGFFLTNSKCRILRGNTPCNTPVDTNLDSPQRTVDLSAYRAAGFDRGASFVTEGLWLVVSLVLFRLCPFSLSALKRAVLRMFGARVGDGVVIKPDVRITFPWKLTLGDHVWLGEESWLLNLAPIEVASHSCISQRAFLCTGSHDYKSPTFNLIVSPIVVEQGAWVGAAAWVGPGVRIGRQAILAANSVATQSLEPSGIYQGNPAVLIRNRELRFD